MKIASRFVVRGFALAAVVLPAVAACSGPAVEPVPPVAPSAPPVVSVAPAPPTVTASAAAAPVVVECKEPVGPRPTVVNVADPWPTQDWHAGPGDSSPRVAKACKQIADRRASLLKKNPGIPPEPVKYLGQCQPSPKGAWALTLVDARSLAKDDDHPEAGWEARFALAHVGPDGKVVRSKKVVGEVSAQGNEQMDWVVRAVFDYDGDGVSEILLYREHHYGDEDRSGEAQMLTFKDGEIVPYAPATGIKSQGILDVDGDRRPDLILAGPFSTDNQCGLDGATLEGPMVVAHSLADGKFSLDDAVAKEVIRAQCGPDAADPYVVTRQGTAVTIETATIRRIACSRMYGVPAADLVSRLRDKYPFPHNADDSLPENSDGKCFPLKPLIDLANTTPPFVIEAPCPPK